MRATLFFAAAALGGASLMPQLSGCAGSGEGLDANGRPSDGGGGPPPLTPDFASIQANVFTPVCAPCHSGAGAPQGLRLDAASSYASLVGVASSEVPQLLRVEPADPGGSYLVQKIEGNAAVGARMPLDQPALPRATILVIRQWIQDGALPSASAAEGNVMLVVKAVSASPRQIAVGFAGSVDASLVSPMTVELLKLDDPAAAIATSFSMRISPYNPALLLLEPRADFASGRYRLTLRGSGPVALADWNGTALDGDGDGRPSGDYSATIAIGSAN